MLLVQARWRFARVAASAPPPHLGAALRQVCHSRANDPVARAAAGSGVSRRRPPSEQPTSTAVPPPRRSPNDQKPRSRGAPPEERQQASVAAGGSALQQPHRRRNRHSRSRTTDPDMLLTRAIGSAESLKRLQWLLTHRGDDFNSIHVSAFVSRLVHVANMPTTVPLEPPLAQAHFVVTDGDSAQSLDNAGDVEGAAGSGAAGTAAPSLRGGGSMGQQKTLTARQQRLADAHALLDGCRDIISRNILQLDARGIANIMHGFGRLEYCNAPALLGDLLHVSGGEWPELTPQGYANLVTAVVNLGHRPDRRWLRDFFAESKPLLGSFELQALSMTARAVARLGRPPPPPPDDWLSSFCTACLRHFAEDSAEGGSRVAASSRQRAASFDYGAAAGGAGSGSSSSTTSSSSGGGGAAAAAAATTSMHHAEERVGEAPAPAVSATAEGDQGGGSRRAGGGHVGSPTVTVATAAPDVAAWRRSVDQAHGLAGILWGLGRVEASVPHGWLQSACAAVERHKLAFTPQGISNAVWGAARLAAARRRGAAGCSMRGGGSSGPHPLGDTFVRRVLVEHCGSMMHRFNAKELSSLLYSFAASADRNASPPAVATAAAAGAASSLSAPPPSWADAFFAASQPLLPSADLRTLSSIIYSLGKLQLQPPPQWLCTWQAATRRHLPRADPHALSAALTGLAWLRAAPEPGFTAAALEAARCNVARFRQEELFAVVTAAGELGAAPSRQLLADLLQGGGGGVGGGGRGRAHDDDKSRRSGPGSPLAAHLCSTERLRRLLRAAARFGQPPPDAWSAPALAVLHDKHDGLSPGQLAELLSSLGALKLNPGPKLLSAVLGRLTSAMGELSASELAAVVAALRALSVRPQAGWLDAVAQELRPQLSSLTTGERNRLAEDFAALGLKPPLETSQ